MKMPMDLTEVKLRRKDVFEGKIMTVHVDDVRLPNGEEATREVVDHVDGAAVLALDAPLNSPTEESVFNFWVASTALETSSRRKIS